MNSSTSGVSNPCADPAYKLDDGDQRSATTAVRATGPGSAAASLDFTVFRSRRHWKAVQSYTTATEQHFARSSVSGHVIPCEFR